MKPACGKGYRTISFLKKEKKKRKEEKGEGRRRRKDGRRKKRGRERINNEVVLSPLFQVVSNSRDSTLSQSHGWFKLMTPTSRELGLH